MTKLNVNFNKVALIKNSSGEHPPDLIKETKYYGLFGVRGSAVHPRPDQRHIHCDDIPELKEVALTEFNIEGNPSPLFRKLLKENQQDKFSSVSYVSDVLAPYYDRDSLKHRVFGNCRLSYSLHSLTTNVL